LTAFSGSDPNALTAAGPVVFGSNDTPQSRLVLNAVAGQTYQILVGGQDGAMGNIQLNIAGATPPVNDNYANRITLSGTVALASGSTVDSTVEGWEQPSSYLGRHPTSVWWEWTAPVTGILVATAHSDDFDPTLWIYRGVLPSAPEGPWNIDGTNGIARLEPWVNAGETYYFAVGNFSRGMGDVDLQLKLSGELDIRVEVPSSAVVRWGNSCKGSSPFLRTEIIRFSGARLRDLTVIGRTRRRQARRCA
jgi:hypothetical protein